MKSAKVLSYCLIGVLILGFSGIASAADNEPQGTGLVQQLWTDMKNADADAIAKYISSEFQSIHEDGTRNNNEQLELIKNLSLGEYTLSDFCVTENDSVIIVTYFVTVEETLAGKRLPARKSARLSAWQKTDEGWKWIIHANVRPME
ncbi:MAG TPA: nuclear transport factor 2 family protein [Deltaproteobacteria bacterium]|nr:nuclear transport factor 2 family protein [Deltaproteobacteria bacterium]